MANNRKRVPPRKPPQEQGPNRKARRAKPEPGPTPVELFIARLLKGTPTITVEMTPGQPIDVSWLNGADVFAAPSRLREAAQVVERHLGLRE